MTKTKTTTTKKQRADRARKRGQQTFMADCKHHGRTRHYASDGKCLQCVSMKNTKQTARRGTDHALAARRRASLVNSNTTQRLQKLGRTVPTPEQLAECYEFIKAAPMDCEMDHAVPLKGEYAPGTDIPVVCGLHVAWNLEPMAPRSNQVKSNIFDPDRLWFQRPYNSFPGGQFHGDLGEAEFSRYTVYGGVALELMTEDEFRRAILKGAEAANAEMFGEAA